MSKWDLENSCGDDQAISPGTTPVKLSSVLTGSQFYAGTTAVEIHNNGPGYAYVSRKAGDTPPAVAAMRKIAPYTVLIYKWSRKSLNKLWIATDDAADVVIVAQSGIAEGT